MRRTKFTPNELILHQDYAELILRNIKHEEVGRVKVDVSDIPSAVRARKEAERKYFGEFAYRGNELQCDS